MKMSLTANSFGYTVLGVKPTTTILPSIMHNLDQANQRPDLRISFLPMTFSSPIPQNNVACPKKQPVVAWESLEMGEFERTNIEGIPIASFKVWGECRLCIPQLIRNVLSDFDFDTILSMCSKLQIFCSQCNSKQLEILHRYKIIPEQVNSCGLIRKSDAERICKVLLHQEVMDDFIEGKQHPVNLNDYPNRIEIMHNCFGKQTGYFLPDLYTSEEAKCIHCSTCSQLLAPATFVGHTHQNQEATKVTHWGFDSANWRLYIKINRESNETEDTVNLKKLLDQQKNKFTRKSASEPTDSASKETPGKSSPSELQATSPTKTKLPPPPKLFNIFKNCPIPKAFENHGPPVLVNPEAIVPIDQAGKFDKDFAPNVCLANVKGGQALNKRSTHNDQLPVDQMKKEVQNISPFKRPYPFEENKSKKGFVSKESPFHNELTSVDKLDVLRSIVFSNLGSEKMRQQLIQQFILYNKSQENEKHALAFQKSRLEENNRFNEKKIQQLQNEIVQLRASSQVAAFQARQRYDQLDRENSDLQKQIREAGCPDVHKTRAKYLGLKAELDEVIQERNCLREKLEQKINENRVEKELILFKQKDCLDDAPAVQNGFKNVNGESDEESQPFKKVAKLDSSLDIIDS